MTQPPAQTPGEPRVKLDAFNHLFPRKYYERMLEVAPKGRDMHKRVREIPSIVDLDERFRIMDRFGDDYAQVICLPSPPIEVFGPPPLATELARLANDGLAELVRQHPRRFPAFVASLPMNDPDGLLKEAERAVRALGAVGVQVFTNVLGRPLTARETLPLFDPMAELDLPIWLHPARARIGPTTSARRRAIMRSGGLLAGRTRPARRWHTSSSPDCSTGIRI
jgi:uncharacterized protein